MKCSRCSSLEDRVVESRQNTSGSSIRRRRECTGCGYRFTTYEYTVERPLMIVKRDGRREKFDISKLERGIQISLEKRPVPQTVIENTIHEIADEANIRGEGSEEISTKDIGDMVLGKLNKIDRVAYVRFASVYKLFENVEEFVKEIEAFRDIKK